MGGSVEALHPLAPPGSQPDARPAWSECEQELWADVQPEFAAIHELRSDLPGAFLRIVRRCLEKDPRHRVQSYAAATEHSSQTEVGRRG